MGKSLYFLVLLMKSLSFFINECVVLTFDIVPQLRRRTRGYTRKDGVRTFAQIIKCNNTCETYRTSVTCCFNYRKI